MAQLAVLIAGLLLTTESQASDVAEADPSAVQGFLSKYMTAPAQRAWTSNHGLAANEGTGSFMVIDDKPAQRAIREEEKAAQKLLPNGNNTPMTLYAVGAGLFALMMMLRVRMWRGLRPATVLASNGALVSDMSERMVPGLGDNILEMKSHFSSSVNGAVLSEGISYSKGSEACAEYFRANRVSDDLEWDPLNLLPSDPITGLQPAVFAVDAGQAIRRRQLGTSDLVVSDVCLGTMTWGKQNTLEEGVQQLDCAFDDYGLNFLDTAEMYPVPTVAETQGKTDETIGAWLKKRGRRDDVVLASKICGASERITWVRGDGRGTRVTEADIVEGVEGSLKRLGTDYLDLLQIHWPDRYVPLFGSGTYDASQEREAVPFVQQLQALKKLVDQGKVRHIGVSNETPYGVCQFIQEHEKDPSLPRICSIQNSYSLLVRSDFESGLTETCAQTDVGLLAYSPLAGGILTGKYGKAVDPKGARLNLFPGFMDRYSQSLAKEAVAEYERIAAKYDLTPAQLALKWCYSQPRVASTIIGATSMEQLRENIDAFFLDELPEECLDAVAKVYARYRDPSKTS